MSAADDMACEELVVQVTEYLDAALTLPQRSRFEDHVDECPGCADILEQFQVVIAATGALRPQDAAAIDPTVRDHLLAAFHQWKSEPP